VFQPDALGFYGDSKVSLFQKPGVVDAVRHEEVLLCCIRRDLERIEQNAD
jgi:hypothetical protein